MRKVLSCLLAFCFTLTAFSQLTLGTGVTYKRFEGTYQKSTSGFHTRVQYQKGLYGLGLGYTYRLPFDKRPHPSSRAESYFNYGFQTLDLFVRRTVLGTSHSKATLYAGLGTSLVLLSYKEKPLLPELFSGPFVTGNGRDASLSLNGFLGAEYKLGRISLVSEGSYAIPTMEHYLKNRRIEITAPSIGVTFGVKIPLQ